MPIVKQVKAAKEYSRFGIKKGDLHFVWKIRTGKSGTTYRSLRRPRASQLTASDKKSRLYAALEACEDVAGNREFSKDDLEPLGEAFEYGVSEAEEVQQEYEDASASCDTGGLNERFDAMAESCGEMAQSFQEAQDRVGEIVDEIEEEDADVGALLQEVVDLCGNIDVEVQEC